MEEESIMRIKFDGTALTEGRMDVKDFAQSVSATAELLSLITRSTSKNREVRIDLGVIRKGSFDAELVVKMLDIVQLAPALLPFIAEPQTISATKQIIEVVKSLIKARLFLKGEKPTKVEIKQDGGSPHVTIHNNQGQINLTVNTFNLLQSDAVNQRLSKIVKPMLKEHAEVDSIEISGGETEETTTIAKGEAQYFEKTEELQMIEYRVRGIVTALDRKTSNGKISVGEKRVNFELEIVDIAKLDKVLNSLIESMKLKVEIMVIGEAAFDFESNLKKIKIRDVETDPKLL